MQTPWCMQHSNHLVLRGRMVSYIWPRQSKRSTYNKHGRDQRVGNLGDNNSVTMVSWQQIRWNAPIYATITLMMTASTFSRYDVWVSICFWDFCYSDVYDGDVVYILSAVNIELVYLSYNLARVRSREFQWLTHEYKRNLLLLLL